MTGSLPTPLSNLCLFLRLHKTQPLQEWKYTVLLSDNFFQHKTGCIFKQKLAVTFIQIRSLSSAELEDNSGSVFAKVMQPNETRNPSRNVPQRKL